MNVEQTTGPAGVVEEMNVEQSTTSTMMAAEEVKLAVEDSGPAIPAAASGELAAAAEPADALGRFREALSQEEERRHLERIQEHARLQQQDMPKRRSRRRAQAWRQCRRQLQRRVRAHVVEASQQLCALGCKFAEAAQRLQVNQRTLRHWIKEQARAPQQAASEGRPRKPSTPAQRNTVLAFLNDEGPAVSVPTLRQHFPDLARAELADLQQRYRAVWRQRHPQLLHVLHWQEPGRVWAMDFAEPSLLGAVASLPPIDGIYPYLLAIRDLASGYNLCWLPVREATAEVVARVLRNLFVLYSPPLVLKTDNGSHFRAELARLLASARVAQLFSPPYWPRYNGAIEASIGSLKSRTEALAAAQGRPGHWTWADAAAARLEANASGNPKKVRAPTPAETWALRAAVSPEERARFQAAVARERVLVRQEKNIDSDTQLDHWETSAVDRQALPRVLVEHGYLLFRRRRIPTRIWSRKAAK
jgi:Integrase core domain